MKKLLLELLCLLLMLSPVQAEGVSYVGERYSVPGSPYTLTVFWPEREEAPAQRQEFQELFFDGYPAMYEVFGTSDAVAVSIYFHHSPDSIAYTSGGSIYVSLEYMNAHPGDHNLLVHELFHVVQNGYPGDDSLIPALTEGLADYVRSRYSSLPEESWSLSSYQEGQSYTDSYTVMGGFLNWMADTYGETVLIRLNRILHEGRYTPQAWRTLTGSTLEELWAAYAASGI